MHTVQKRYTPKQLYVPQKKHPKTLIIPFSIQSPFQSLGFQIPPQKGVLGYVFEVSYPGTSLDKDKATMESKARRKADARALGSQAGGFFFTKKMNGQAMLGGPITSLSRVK